MKNSTRRIISMILVLCMCLAMLPTLRVPVEAAGYYTEDDLRNVKSTIISNSTRANYVTTMMKKHILSETSDYRVARNLRDGKSIVFMFDGCSDNVDDPTYGDYTKYHLSAYCAVVKLVNGVPKVVYESENCSTIPDNPRDESLNKGSDGKTDPVPTVLDGVYNILSINHNKTYAALHVQNNNGVAPAIRCTWTTSKIDSSTAINIHARSKFENAPHNGISSTSYSSTGCFNVGLTNDNWNEYNNFIYAVLGVSNGRNVKLSSQLQDKGLVIVDRSQYKSTLEKIYGADNNRTAKELVDKITEYTDNLDYTIHVHSYTGEYFDAAHPHNIYQKCSCGAIQYTGGKKTISSCEACNPVGISSKYNAVLPFKAYLKGTADIVPYSDKQMTNPSGEIWATDECTITAVYSNGACEVKYPAGDKTKIAYTQLSNFIDNTGASLSQQMVSAEIKTYIRANTNSAQYGHTDPGDVVYKLGTSGKMTQIFYPTANGYKLAWLLTSELPERKYDDRFNPYCPIKSFPCATATFEVYESDHTTYKGKIFTTDYCTINAVYADGWCEVTYPTSSGDKTGYITLNKFVHDVDASHVNYTADAKTTVHKNSSLPGDMNWYISSGDPFIAVGSSGSSIQVLYPIDAQYGGGYKLGWISTNDLPRTTYTVSYNANGGSGAPGNQTKSHGVSLTLSSTKPVRDGYTFVGWATSSSADSATYMPGASYTNDANLTLYAVWKLNRYEVSYNANGGSDAPAAQSKIHGQSLTLSTAVPRKHNTVTFDANGGSVDISTKQIDCTFRGWATTSTATAAAYQPGGTFTANANTTLYAVWQNGTLGSYPMPVRSGYVFDGWYTEASGGSQVTGSTTISGNTMLYAHWILATYGVNYDANGGTGAPESQIKTHGQDLILSSVVPARENYFFCGWGTEEAPDAVQYQPGATYTANSDILLVAVWEEVALDSITVAAYPSKTVYNKDDMLDTTGLTLRATYTDGSVKTISNGFSCSPMILNTVGTQRITVTYGGKTTTFNVTVNEPILSSISIATMPTKTTYYVGDTLDTTGLTLTATYSNGSTETIRSGFSCSPMKLNKAGSQTVTVSYGEKTASFTVTVKETVAGIISVTNAVGSPGETVTVAINLRSNPGIIAARLKVAYPSGALTLVEAKDGGILGEYLFGGNMAANPYILTWENGLSDRNFTTTGTLVYLTFRIEEDAPAGEFPVTVSYEPDDVYNKDLTNIAFDVTQGTVTVKEAEKVDPDAPQIIAENKTASCGTTVTLDVQIANNPGFSVLNVAFLYDTEYLTLRGIENHLSAMTMTQGASVVWDAAENYTGDGVLCTLTFDVAENAPEGAYEIQVLFISASNSDFEEVTMDGVSGILEVRDILYGDVNGDGKIASVDLAMLRKYIASVDPITGASTVAVKAGADCNGDGKINSVDLAMLRRYLASVDPITGESTIVLGP